MIGCAMHGGSIYGDNGSDSSDLEINSVTNGEPMQIAKSRRDTTETRFMYMMARVRGCEPAECDLGLKQMCQQEESYNNQVVIQL